MKKKVLAITGIRSEYDILYPVIDTLRNDAAFEVEIAVSSAHLSDFHGLTYKQIEADGFKIADKIDCLLNTNRETQRSKGVGLLTYALSQTVERVQPDILLVVGDREESIATCIVGNYMNILTAHIGGGDPVFGNADDPIRVACSKLAHIHFTTTQAYADNLIAHLHEDPFRVIFSGNPALKNIKNTPSLSLSKLSEDLDFDIADGRYVVLVKHPLSSEFADAARQMAVTLEALDSFAKQYQFKIVASYPNTDPGAYDLLQVIKHYEHLPHFKFNKTLPRLQFVNLLRQTKALVGNSSMGVLEAPSYKIPVVNVGNRQQGRLQAGNIVFVDHHCDAIMQALEQACFNPDYRSQVQALISPYENGDAAAHILETLKKISPKDPNYLVKRNLC